MPVVTVNVWDEVLTPEREAALLKGVTDVVADVLGENARPFTVAMVVAVPMERWSVGGVVATSFDDLPARRASMIRMLDT